MQNMANRLMVVIDATYMPSYVQIKLYINLLNLTLCDIRCIGFLTHHALLTSMWVRETRTRPTVSRRTIHIPCDIPYSASSKHPSDRGRFKPVQTFSHLSIQISAVVVIHKLGIIHKNNHRWWSCRDLTAIIYLGLSTISS